MTGSAVEARRYALKLLGYRSRSERELRRRLSQRGYQEPIVGETICFLKASGLVDDLACAENLRRIASEGKMLGYEAARNFLSERGIPRDVIDAVISYDEDREFRNARKLLDKRLRTMGNYLTDKDRKKLWSYLLRRGYSNITIRKAMSEMNIEEDSGI